MHSRVYRKPSVMSGALSVQSGANFSSGIRVGKRRSSALSDLLFQYDKVSFFRLRCLSGTSLLMSVIRTLSASEDQQQREVEKAKIEKAYRECDQKLDTLINDNYETLTKTIQSYSSISARIKSSREKMRQVKEDLTSCKELLHCKRDELRRLWLEGVEQKRILSMLDNLEKVKNAPQKLDSFISRKYYLHATELVTETVASLEGELAGVEALRDLRIEMQDKKEELHHSLINELHNHLYVKSATNFHAGLQRGSSMRVSGEFVSSPALPHKPTLKQVTHGSKRFKKLQLRNRGLEVPSTVDDDKITEDLNSNPEEDSEHFMSVLIESLALLKKIPDTVEEIKSRMNHELANIVQRATTEVAEKFFLSQYPFRSAKQRGESIVLMNQPKLLLELLELLFDRFHSVAVAHMSILGSINRLKAGFSDNEMYTMDDIWSQIQSVLQLHLSSYLDMKNATVDNQVADTFSENTTDIGMFFAKRKMMRPKRQVLFRFESSSHAISMNNYMREQKREFYGADGNVKVEEDCEQMQMVCKPSVKNVIQVYRPLSQFIHDIEAAMNLDSGGQCSLRIFVSDYIHHIFLSHMQQEIDKNIQTATRGGDSDKALTDFTTQKAVGAAQPLLQTTVAMEKAVSELKDMMTYLPDYADQFLNMICKILKEYKDTCHAMYRGIVQPETEEKRMVSATWVKDEDISRCLRSLPNWINLQEYRRKDVRDSDVETIEDVRERNEKESDLLVTNLGDKLLQQHEVLLDVSDLRLLANLHESLEWFSERIRSFAGRLPSSGENTLATSGIAPLEIPEVDGINLQNLISQAKEFQDMAQMCLLVLHLEVRLHCFYFLIPVVKQSSYHTSVDSVDPDQNVVTLNKDLTSIEEALVVALQSHKFKYIFEGLGHLISFILINGTQYIKRINDNGIKKMIRNIFVLQLSLTNITMSREADLERAKQYYELMYKSSDDILNGIVEQGAVYTELEYRNAVNLLNRSNPGTDSNQLNRRLQRLQEILLEAV
ncbi:exocyst complex component 4-like isoform X2 [Anneissia japonica]|uniref:exocyst complex component 4-like isoform X2 n=1 Tax=Anneissia japonica TaxID=1529436 RepID=UPI001425AE36|nr:exocyst complex component 4-like isoform X2 [Anneissia japonica]